jgi:hypothetical protein
MPLWITFHQEEPGTALLEDCKGESAVELTLSERSVRALQAVVALESFELSAAIGELFLLGVREGQKSSRRRKAAQPNS